MKKDDFSLVYFYQVRHGKFRVLIQELDDSFECWLNHDRIGIMDFIFALPRDEKLSLDVVIDIVMHNLSDYEHLYEEMYMDYKEEE